MMTDTPKEAFPEEKADFLLLTKNGKNIESDASSGAKTIIPSDLDILKSMQKDNPQIETVFIDSDEDDDSFENSNDIEACQVGSHPPFKIRQITPEMLTPKIMKGSNAIALKGDPNSTSTKYLFIPNEVLPLLTKTNGPVTLFVPGMGPMVIPKPAEMIRTTSKLSSITESVQSYRIIPSSKLASDGQSPHLTRIKPMRRLSSDTESIQSEDDYKTKKDLYEPLCDPKFTCWKYRKGVKRDLNGYSYPDRLGFSKAEQRRTQLCLAKIIEAYKLLQYDLNMTKVQVQAVQIQRQGKSDSEDITPKKKRGRPRLHKKLTPIQKRSSKSSISWKEHSDHSEADDSSDFEFGDEDKGDDPDFKISPNIVKQNIEDGVSPPIKRKRGRPRKIQRTNNDSSSPTKLSTSTSKYYHKMYKSESSCVVIESVRHLRRELNPEKPLLIINKTHYLKSDIPKLCRENNVVFPTSDIDILDILGDSLDFRKIIFVKPDILGSYLVNTT